ncbi:MAG: T9SS type A sorting domain-containing protein [Chitinophagales bacterium]|nr:T9SS type A sorting domain-containing protein [Chitinophagales bacterium]
MKKIYTVLSVFSFTVLSLQAQTIITIPGDTSVVSGVVTDEFDPFDVHLEVVNTTNQSQTFTWMMKGYTTPSPNWEVKLCDNNNCYDLLLNAGPYESKSVGAGDTMDFKFQFSPHCINGTGTSDILVYITGDSAATAKLLHFKATLTTTCVSSVGSSSVKSITLHPNPVKGSFIVSGLEDEGNLSFEVYDLEGKLVKSKVKNASAEQIEISVESLAEGTYVLKVSDERGQVVASSRLNKVK